MKDEALYELEQKLRLEQRVYRTELIQVGKFIIMVLSLLLLGPSVFFTRGNEARSQMDMDQVQVSVRYDLEKCQSRIEAHGNAFQMLQAVEEAKRRPLLVSIHNRSQRVSQKVKWSLAVHRKGHSDDLTAYDDLPHDQQMEFKRSNAYANDKILGPGESDEECYMLPKMPDGYSPEDLAYTVKLKTSDFFKKSDLSWGLEGLRAKVCPWRQLPPECPRLTAAPFR